jgi:hypothetical protein
MPVTNSASSSRLFVYDSDKEVEQLLQEAKVEAKQKLMTTSPSREDSSWATSSPLEHDENESRAG